MTAPIYIPNLVKMSAADTAAFIEGISWLDRTEARQECFMSLGGGVSYTYGQGRGIRTYESIDMDPQVLDIMAQVNSALDDRGWGPMNGCFLNHYTSDRQALGWHADDFDGMDHSRPVAVVSFGEEREIWWRPNGQRGETPPERRQSLAHGSMFIMPPGFQHTHEHRIPKGSRAMGSRVSLTYRAFLD